MELKIRYYLFKRKKKIDGEIPIYLKFTRDRKSVYMATGVSVRERFWNANEQRTRSGRSKGHPRAERLNRELSALKDKAENKLKDLTESIGTPSPAQLKAAMEPAQSTDFFEFAKAQIGKLQEEGKFWPAKASKNAVAKFREMTGKDHLPLSAITTEMLHKYAKYLRTEKENGPNTISKALERVKMIMQAADEKGLLKKNPFDGFKSEFVKRVRTEKTRLEVEQLFAIEALDLELGTSLWHVRNYFLFSVYNAGIRFGDLARLTWDDIQDGRLKYRMGKTSQWKNIKLLPESWHILEHYRGRSYIFPVLDDGMTGDRAYRRIASRNALANKDLKDIANLAGIESRVTFHTARHSSANWMRQSGMSVYDISKALAHSDIKVTQQYLASFDENSLDTGMEQQAEKMRERKYKWQKQQKNGAKNEEFRF